MGKVKSGKDLAEVGGLSGHVLVAEDDESSRKLFTKLLQKHGYKVTEACNGVEALELVAKNPPDVIVPCEICNLQAFSLQNGIRRMLLGRQIGGKVYSHPKWYRF